MSRELKFKVWSKEKHTFLHTREEFNPNKGLEFLWYDGVREGWRGIGYFIEKAESFEVVQYTGLVDKNEVRIFEGDIVRICVDDSPESPEWELCPVVYNRGGFALWVTSYDGKRRYFEGIGEFLTLINDKEYVDGEVIGNIFEDSTLIEPSFLEELYNDE